MVFFWLRLFCHTAGLAFRREARKSIDVRRWHRSLALCISRSPSKIGSKLTNSPIGVRLYSPYPQFLLRTLRPPEETLMKKTVATLLAPATIAAILATTATDASAQRGWGWGGWGWGPAVAAGVIGGAVIAGAIIASRPPGYVVYEGYAQPVYAPGCYWASQPVYDGAGRVVGYTGQPVQVCPGYPAPPPGYPAPPPGYVGGPPSNAVGPPGNAAAPPGYVAAPPNNTAGPPRYAASPPGGDPVAYCMQRFRSYDPKTGTYLGNDGQRHPCP